MCSSSNIVSCNPCVCDISLVQYNSSAKQAGVDYVQYTSVVVGASLSEPHTSDTTYFRSVRLCIYILCIRTSLPPKAPDACAHARSVVLILAHLDDGCM